jgi:DUF4097 and DUF4098 domain-containing protein YvlB
MPTFETPGPISVTVEIGVGDIWVEASDRADTSVEALPSDPGKRVDVSAAEQTHVEFADGRLLVRAPKRWRQWTPWGGGGSIDVRIELPSGSHVRAEAGVAALRCGGRLGNCQFRTGVGDIRLDQTGRVELKTGAGDISLDRAEGKAEVTTGSGAVGIARVDGTTVVKNGNGDTWLGEVAGDARVSAANGGISIDLARATIVAKTSNGDVRVGEISGGVVVAQSAFGAVDVGVRDGVAAWLELDTKFGSVQNRLETAGRPGAGEDTVEVHAHTGYGDITIRRSSAGGTGRDAA